MPFIKGQSGNPSGRAKGTPNKVTGCMKVEAWKVFNLLQNNVDEKGIPLPLEKQTSLVAMARKDPPWFYSVFGARLLPKDVTLRTITSIDDLTDAEKESLLSDLQDRIGNKCKAK
jgi:hypothetical protein